MYTPTSLGQNYVSISAASDLSIILRARALHLDERLPSRCGTAAQSCSKSAITDPVNTSREMITILAVGIVG